MIKNLILSVSLLFLLLSSCIKEKDIPNGNRPLNQFVLSYKIYNDTSLFQKVIYYSHTIYPSRGQDTISNEYTRENIGGTKKDTLKITTGPPFPGDPSCSLGMDLFCYFKKADETVFSDSAHYQSRGFFNTPDKDNASLKFTYFKVDETKFKQVEWNAPLLRKLPIVDTRN